MKLILNVMYIVNDALFYRRGSQRVMQFLDVKTLICRLSKKSRISDLFGSVFSDTGYLYCIAKPNSSRFLNLKFCLIWTNKALQTAHCLLTLKQSE